MDTSIALSCAINQLSSLSFAIDSPDVTTDFVRDQLFQLIELLTSVQTGGEK